MRESKYKIGDKFWRLTLIAEAGKNKNNKRICDFLCDCGNIVYAKLPTQVKYADSKSCGCLNKEATHNMFIKHNEDRENNIKIGDKFFKLTIVEEAWLDKRGRRLVKCLCNCGKTTIVKTLFLIRSDRPTKSCGCNSLANKTLIEPWVRDYSGKITHNNCTRKLPFDLTFEQFVEISSRKCIFCNKEPSINLKSKYTNDKRNVIDRIDSRLGYIYDNCQSACIECNSMKSNLENIYFLNKIKNIYENLDLKNNQYIAKNNIVRPNNLKIYDEKDPYHKSYNKYIRKNNETRKLYFELSNEEYELLISSNCFYCGIMPSRYCKESKIYRNGIDRINNDISYIWENCVSCCYECNLMKNERAINKFYAAIINIYNVQHANNGIFTNNIVNANISLNLES